MFPKGRCVCQTYTDIELAGERGGDNILPGATHKPPKMNYFA